MAPLENVGMANFRLRLLLMILFGVTSGSLLAIGTYRLASRLELAHTAVNFRDLTDAHAVHMEREIAVCLESLYALRSLFHASEQVTEEEFHTFASALRTQHRLLQALEWIPEVTEAARLTHEAGARAQGHENYRISERLPDGSLTSAGPRVSYYPVRFIDPLEDQEIVLGFDLGSEKSRREMLRRSAREFRPVISPPVSLVQGDHGPLSLLASLPMARSTGDELPPKLRGSFLLAVISLDTRILLSDGESAADFGEIHLYLDATSNSSPDLSWQNADEPIHDVSNILMSRDIPVGVNTWKIEVRPSSSYLKRAETSLPLALAFGVAGLWLALVGAGAMLIRTLNKSNRERDSKFLESVVSSLSEGVVVADTDGHLLLVNEAARRFVGRIDLSIPVSDWPAKVGTYRPKDRVLFHPNELPLVRAMRGEVVPATEIYVQNRATPEGAWVTVSGSPLISLNGGPQGGVIVIRDHTSEKQAKALADRLSQAVETTADAVFITRRDGTIEYVNEGFTATTGYTRSEALGQTPRLLKSGFQDDSFYSQLWSTILEGKVHRHTIVNRHKNGTLYTALQTITPMRDSKDEITHFVSVLTDMTESIQRREQEIELKLAAKVQQRLYPQRVPRVGDWEFAGLVLPAEATCGDYYDFIEIDDSRLCVTIGDVCGHGLGPALVMVEVRALLRSFASEDPHPRSILSNTNRSLAADLEAHCFVTLVMVSLDLSKKELTWLNAGHPSGYVLDKNGDVRVELTSQTLPLGILPELEFTDNGSAALESGDLIVLITDGLTEAADSKDRLFGPAGVLEAIRSLRDRPVDEIAQGVLQRALQFAEVPQTDDITLVVCRVG
jgi:PAS domain S-box-containing protein